MGGGSADDGRPCYGGKGVLLHRLVLPPTSGNLSFRLYVNWRFMRGIEAQFLALQKGFNELIPQHLLKPFDQKELEVGAYWAEPSPQSRLQA